MARAEMLSSWLRQTGRIMATVCIGLLAVMIGYKVVFGANGTVEWRAKRAQYQQLQLDIQKATTEHQELENSRQEAAERSQHDRERSAREARIRNARRGSACAAAVKAGSAQHRGG